MHRLWPLVPLALLVTLLAPGAQADPQPTKRPTDEQRGRELYKRHCEACHGAFAKGQGPAAAALVTPVPDLTGKVAVDDATIDLVIRGRGVMPSYEQSFDRFDAKRVVAHMSRVSQPGAEEQAPSEEPPLDDEDDAEPPPDDAAPG